MGKFDKLENKFQKIANKASLKNNTSKSSKNILVYNVPVEWTEILKENGISFSSYAKIAILEKMKKDELL